MSKELPYLSSPGTIPKILDKIIEASVPESFNADFLGTKLGFPGGNQRRFISWAKKCGILNQDGTPTQIYKNFRNPDFRGAAMAKALKTGYEELYIRNSYAHDLSDKELTKLVSEITGKPHDNAAVKYIVRSYKYARSYADFDAKVQSATSTHSKPKDNIKTQEDVLKPSSSGNSKSFNLGLNYTINLVLPKTDDPAIYDAIFKSLKENLLDE